LGADNHPKRPFVRRITLKRPGEADVTLVTDLVDGDRYPAEELLEHYLERWGIDLLLEKE
jgi:hypothetical protein